MNRKTIIFDMDGTLYEFNGDSFKNSGLYDVVIENTINYISNNIKKTKEESRRILESILKKYGTSISVGLEKELGFDRYDYFNKAWDVNAREYVQGDLEIRSLLLELRKDFNFILLSDAPRIWIEKVLECLDVQDIFGEDIFSGEGNVRKEFGNAFEEILKKFSIESSSCIVIGDQEDTDIVPAKKIGMKTVYVGDRRSDVADHSMNNIFELRSIIKKLDE